MITIFLTLSPAAAAGNVISAASAQASTERRSNDIMAVPRLVRVKSGSNRRAA
jgi:hypothetical protein